MQSDQLRMLCTDIDNRVRVDRVPQTYVNLVMPPPEGQARAGIAYHEAEVEDEPADKTHQDWGDWLSGAASDTVAFCRRMLGMTPEDAGYRRLA
jgi:hypothetical protein